VRKIKAAAAIVAVAAVAASVVAYVARTELTMQAQLAAQQQRIATLERTAATQPDWPAIAAAIGPSVVTVETDAALGSAWVAHADAGGSDLVTNFHVVADAWTAGKATVTVRAGDVTTSGTIVRVDQSDDLAVVHVREKLVSLAEATQRPKVGATVMAVGSPLGLSGTVTIGIVSGFRSLAGSDYVQFSAPISPGNSGGPVVDSRGRVVAVASAKLVGDGVEALSLAIPVQTVCLTLVTCSDRAA
jgi:putative serine protease PepD